MLADRKGHPPPKNQDVSCGGCAPGKRHGAQSFSKIFFSPKSVMLGRVHVCGWISPACGRPQGWRWGSRVVKGGGLKIHCACFAGSNPASTISSKRGRKNTSITLFFQNLAVFFERKIIFENVDYFRKLPQFRYGIVGSTCGSHPQDPGSIPGGGNFSQSRRKMMLCEWSELRGIECFGAGFNRQLR